MQEFEAVIGLEVHAQLLTRSKLFCSCSTAFGAPPNSQTCPVCLGLPGALPVVNREAVAMAVRAGLALGCRINLSSLFARKNYFYPDLPKGYQISQYDQPLAEDGGVAVLTGERMPTGRVESYQEKIFGIIRVHLEDDAGKSIHRPSGDSLVNLNRTGVPLIEIVSKPDLRSSQEAFDFLSTLRRILLYLEICDGNMEEGSLRCDANVSVRRTGDARLGTKTEIKNLNSFRFLQRAIDYEVQRQIHCLSQGGRVEQETRLWDEERGQTFVMRSKEEAEDYRYFPDPDLLPLKLDRSWLAEQQQSLPELPVPRALRFEEQFSLGREEALLATQTREFADFLEEMVVAGAPPREAYNWLIGDMTSFLKKEGIEIGASRVQPAHLAKLILLVRNGKISGKIAKEVFETMFEEGADPELVVEKKGLRQISDRGQLQEIIREVMAANPGEVAAYRQGRLNLLGFFVGKVMQATGGQANPQMVNEMLRVNLLEGEPNP